MRKVEELTMEEYMDLVIASDTVKDLKGYCRRHDIDYQDVLDYDWD